MRWAALAAVALAGCGAIPWDADPVPMSLLAREYNSGSDQRERGAIRSQVELDAVWARVYSRRSPEPAAPGIDFAQQMVIVAAMGERPTGGYSIELGGAGVKGGVLYVEVTETSPGQLCATTAALTAPVVLASVPRLDGVPSFVEREETHGCPF